MKHWQADRLLPGFEALELAFSADYDGPVVATLVRLPMGEAPRGAVLYVHGYNDYFFQAHMARRFAAEGYAFHALDLRKHGRSLRPGQHPNFCKDIAEYYEDITRAIEEIGAPVLLAGHSTGGLICSLYAHEGGRKGAVTALWLNSPFLEWRTHDWKRPQIHMAAAIGRLAPFTKSPEALPRGYTESLLAAGWEMDLGLKPVEAFPVYLGWIGAICDAHAKVHRGLSLRCPVLSMHSDGADVVLDWRHIAKYSRMLGPDVTVLAFPGGLHDLVLSRSEIREEVFRQLFSWTAACHQPIDARSRG
jgi:alpha-beta hydrolase superfamily lysophospholipase